MVKCHEMAYLDYRVFFLLILSDVFKIFWCTWSNSKIPFYSILLVFNLSYDKVCNSIVYKVFFIVYRSAVSTKSPTVNISSKATALLQRLSNLKRGCKWVTRSWWLLSGKAHKWDLNVELPKSTEEVGTSPEEVGYLSAVWTEAEATSPLWF